ncbi:heat shock factor protein HSF30 isoform X1 [Eucalyptus grandis]|uniref:heat shock factor protein HSF30 isoform X1 n=1 Tax=Eucalyptus grandis TaxID=71139 RepID=UPI00192ED127|nr:heat shock factor protein HSF30 isoform X1 [Eucalyptus grandis]
MKPDTIPSPVSQTLDSLEACLLLSPSIDWPPSVLIRSKISHTISAFDLELGVRMTTALPGGGCTNGPCASFLDTLFRESSVELKKAGPFTKSQEEFASIAVLDSGDPGQLGSLFDSVPSPQLAIGHGEVDTGPLLRPCLTRPEPHSALAAQVVKIEEGEEDEEVEIIADPRDAAAVSPSCSLRAAADEVARPMQGLGEAGPAPFLRKTYEMVSDPSTDPVLSWSSSRDSFVVWDPHEFSKQVLPRYFKHSNFSSFIRQLNTYGFRKIDTDRWEFANRGFQEGKKHLLKNIRRRRKLSDHRTTSSSTVASDYPEAGKEAELEMLKRDQEALKAEILKLREERENSQHEINQVIERIRYAECRCWRMFLFLSKAAKTPNFVQHVIQEKRQKRELEACELSKKSKLLGPDDEATKYLLDITDHKIQSPNVDCLRIGDDSAPIESWPNNVLPLDLETVQMHNPWSPPMGGADFRVMQGQTPDQMAGASPSDLPSVFHEKSEKLLGDNMVVGNDAMDDPGIYLELEGLIEKSCGWREYTIGLGKQAAGLMP